MMREIINQQLFSVNCQMIACQSPVTNNHLMVDEDESKKERAERLHALKSARRGTTYAEIAEYCGVTPQAVHKWFVGGNIERENLQKLAEFFSVSPAWIEFKDPREQVISTDGGEVANPAKSKYVNIPRYEIRLSAGPGIQVHDEHEEIQHYLAFRRDWIERKGLQAAQLAVVEIDGVSMAPTMNDGDIVLINVTEKSVKDGSIYAFRVGDEVRVKRFFTRASRGEIVIKSDNQLPQFADEIVGPNELHSINIIGRVVWGGGDL